MTTIVHINVVGEPIEGLTTGHVQVKADNIFKFKETVKSVILDMISSYIRYHNFPLIQLPCLDDYLVDLSKEVIIPISESITLKLTYDEVE